MKYKKILGIILCAVLAGTSLVGCGKEGTDKTGTADIEDNNVTAAGELPVVKERVKLTVGVPGDSKITDYDTNAFTKFLEEKTGIDIEFYQFPASGGTEKLNVMLSSGSELPDVVSGFNLSKGTFLKYADENIFVDLTPYIEKYGYWIKEMEKNTKVKKFNSQLTAVDGKKYFMPNVAEQTGNMYGGKAFINKKWLDKLGLAMPETTEDFEKVMKAFTTQDPNGNGKNDEIGFTGSKDGWCEKPVDFLLNSFVYDDYDNGYVVNDGKVSLYYTSDKFKDGMAYISRLAKEGALDVQCYTQENSTLRALCSGNELTVGAFASGSPDGLFAAKPELLEDYVALPPLKGPDGTAYTRKTEFSANCGGFITKYCKNPAAAFRFLDYMLSEEASIFGRYGVEGQDWKEVDESVPCMFESIGAKSRIMQILPYGSIQNSHWNQYNPSYRSAAISDTLAWDGDPLNGEYVKAKALSAYINKGPEEVLMPNMITLDNDDMEEMTEIQTEINSYVKEEISLFVAGTKDVDSDWDNFRKTLENLNIKRYQELLQKGYDNFKNAE